MLTTMCKLLFAMVLGFFLMKKKILTQQVNTKLSTMILQVTCPCLILNSLSTVSNDDPGKILKLFFAGIILYLLLPLIGFLFSKMMRVPKHLMGTYTCMFLFSNCCFMGYPVLQALYGDSAIFYVTIFNMPFNIMYYTLALQLFRLDVAVEESGVQKEKINIKNFSNAGIIASVAALLIFFLKIPIPEIVYTCTGFVGNITTPLSMILIGASLATASLGDIRSEKWVWPMLPLRLIVIPVIVWFGMHLVTDDPVLINTCAIDMGMPVASMVAMGTAPYPRQGKSAAICVAVSTVLSLITIPLMTMIFGHISL